ncbi:glycerophosphodiester phosphodiesterase [Rubinisphaera sp. JC750]|uniref:glycerophosphodiester phosphodiesterase n=1 Tax=Rubinisphaera sp. JC750 TaxID=2898658 RepID=UPI001F23662A|nr:glycerophosphodiester phosphodiesterase [Rubinisphaera sp. JC750]
MRYTLLTACLMSMMSFSTECSAQFIVAHRGASHDAPENTLAAFELAWEQGADAIEGDFYLSSDGEIVCIHDKTTKRVSPNQPELTVAKATAAELRQLDVGSWKNPKYAGEKVPTLKEVLACIPDGKRIFVEVKCGPEIVPTLQKQLAASGLKDNQIVIIAFDRNVVTECRKTMPQYKCSWLTSYKQNGSQETWTPTADAVADTLQATNATGLGTHGNLQVIDEDFVKTVRDAGKEFHVWTVNDLDAAKRFVELGVDSITTDRPAHIRQALPAPAF